MVTKKGLRMSRYLQWMLAVLCFFPGANAEYGLNMPYGVTPTSHKIYDLHMLIFAICCVIAVGVFGVLFYSVVAFRKRPNVKAQQFHDNLWVEIAWTVIPLILVIIMMIPTVSVMVDLNDASRPSMNIKVTGIQWKWQYDYLEEGVGFYSSLSTTPAQIRGEAPKGPHYLLEVDKPLVVPIHTKIRLLFTSNDVNHSWWVPDLGVKKDCIPGYINDAWMKIDKPGTYRGQCTELCGMQHGYMPIVVEAVSEEDYARWVAQQRQSKRK